MPGYQATTPLRSEGWLKAVETSADCWGRGMYLNFFQPDPFPISNLSLPQSHVHGLCDSKRTSVLAPLVVSDKDQGYGFSSDKSVFSDILKPFSNLFNFEAWIVR